MKQDMTRRLARARGSALLDSMIAVVIFSIGILGVVRLQSAAITFSTDAKYRADAAMLADQIIAQMWNSDLSTLSSQYAGANGSGGARYVAWNTLVARMPAGNGTVAVQADGTVDVSVRWLQPGDTSTTPHVYATSTQIVR